MTWMIWGTPILGTPHMEFPPLKNPLPQENP
jgi:hypothetical protein